MEDVKYVTYHEGEPLAIFDTQEKAEVDAEECNCEWKATYYFPTPKKTASKSDYAKPVDKDSSIR